VWLSHIDRASILMTASAEATTRDDWWVCPSEVSGPVFARSSGFALAVQELAAA
jgi:hypothetical protein